MNKRVLPIASFLTLLCALSSCGKVETAPLDLAPRGLPLLMDAPVEATASRSGTGLKVAARSGFLLTLDNTPANIPALRTQYEAEKDRTEILDSDETSLLIRRNELGAENYYVIANVRVGETTYECATDSHALVHEESIGRAMLSACRGLRASSTPLTASLLKSRLKSATNPLREVKLESVRSLGTTILVPKGAKQLTSRSTNAKWSLRIPKTRVAIDVELNKYGAKSEKEVRREAINWMLGTIESVRKTEDGRFRVVFTPRGKLQKLATFTAEHNVVCDGPKSARKTLEKICDSLPPSTK